MDSNLSTINQVEIEAPDPLVSLPGRKSSYREDLTSASTISISEIDPNPNWKILPILHAQVYNMPFYKYFASSQIQLHFVDVSFTSQDEPTQIPLLEKSQIYWAKSQGFKYFHLGTIRFGLNVLIRPSMNINSLCVVIDTRHNQLVDAIIGGFASPLHDDPAFGTVYPKYYVSLADPYIYDLL